jgi:VWFA-related protein
MRNPSSVLIVLITLVVAVEGQSGRSTGYSESSSRSSIKLNHTSTAARRKERDSDVIRVETDLVTIPVRVRTKSGKPVSNLRQQEFIVFENGLEQRIEFFSGEDQPFTVALLLDMSYSSVFKLNEIHSAALRFLGQLKTNDKIMVVSFDERVHVLCEATSDRKVLRIAIEGSKIGSGTGLYSALERVIDEKLRPIPGRKAIVLLSDGVDTSSKNTSVADVVRIVSAEDILIYPIRYNTFDDVQRSRRTTAPVLYDDQDRPYILETPRVKGEREQDYAEANEFLNKVAEETGGRVYKVSSTTNLDEAFTNIANELRKIYSLGYYPSEHRLPGSRYDITIRVYRPDLLVHARESYTGRDPH